MISLKLAEKPPGPPFETLEADIEPGRISGWRIVLAIAAWALTAALLTADLLATIGWMVAASPGPMSEGRMDPLPEIAKDIAEIKIGVFLVLVLLALALLRMVRRPRAMVGAWVVTGAALCSLIATFAISGSLSSLIYFGLRWAFGR